MLIINFSSVDIFSFYTYSIKIEKILIIYYVRNLYDSSYSVTIFYIDMNNHKINYLVVVFIYMVDVFGYNFYANSQTIKEGIYGE